MKRLYLADFDRSLFDTARFQNDLFRKFTSGDSARETEFIAAIPSFSDPATGFYDFFEHAGAYTGMTRSQIIEHIKATIPDPDYTFPDSREWVARQRESDDAIVILTVGSRDYQNLKFTYAPSLGHLPYNVINANKSQFLHAELAGRQVPPYSVSFTPGSFDEIILIDDSAVHLQHLPSSAGILGIHLVRPGGKYSHLSAPPGMRTISNLGEIT
jgi:hypothetical protein